MARIAILKEDAHLRDLLVLILAAEGHEVVPLASLRGLCRLVQSESCNLLLIDLPVMKPADLDPEDWRLLRAATARVPTILCTAWYWASQVVPAELGLVDVIIEPFDLDDLLDRVSRALAGPRPIDWPKAYRAVEQPGKRSHSRGLAPWSRRHGANPACSPLQPSVM